MDLFGRRKIYTSVEDINEGNVVQVINDALTVHTWNMAQEEYLFNYRRGIQPILGRVKEIRPEINNKVVVNNALMVTTFKNGYFLTRPATYIARTEDESVGEKVKELNEYIYVSGKHTADNEITDSFHTVGLGVLYVDAAGDEDRPFSVYSMDPRSAFVVYSRRPGNEPVFAANLVETDDGILVDVFTKDFVFRCIGNGTNGNPITSNNEPTTCVQYVAGVESNVIGEIPIIEYAYNSSRMGAFEAAIPLMDAINTAESNRLDGIEQTIQSLMVTWNCQFDDDVSANKIRQYGMINLSATNESKQDLKILNESLDQTQTQVTIDNLYEQMLEKCGVPSSVRDGGSTSDNVGAVYLRSGWAMADTDARNTEDEFKKANRRFDRIVLKILKKRFGFDLSATDFELAIVRNDMNNLLVKTQAALNMRELGLAPEVAFERSGLSNDPITDVERSKEYIEYHWPKGEQEQETVGMFGAQPMVEEQVTAETINEGGAVDGTDYTAV